MSEQRLSTIAATPPRWISVTESLPNDFVSVIGHGLVIDALAAVGIIGLAAVCWILLKAILRRDDDGKK